MRAPAIVGIVVAAALVLGGGLILTRDSDGNSDTTPPATNNQPETNGQNGQDQRSENTIVYDGSGFSPSNLTVSAGTTITIRNTSSEVLEFNSDDHPAHTDNSELNVEAVAPGQSKTFTVSQTGTHGYHNHLNETQSGTITVE